MGLGSFHGWDFFESSQVYSLQQQKEMIGVEVQIIQSRQMLYPSDKCELMEKERVRDYLLLFASYHSLGTYYMPGIILSISLMFFHISFISVLWSRFYSIYAHQDTE